MTSIARSISSLRPDSEWTLTGDTLDGLVWLDEVNTQPTNSEVYAEIARLQAEYEANEYQRQRALAYPSITDQLDLLYHGGMDAWKAAITAVKEEYPKP